MYSRPSLLKSRPELAAVAHGFTLIELMITIAVIAILLGIAAPSFNDAVLSSKLGSYANNLVSSATLARSEAIKRNSAVTLCMSANGTTCASTGGWEQGWIVACSSADTVACNGAASGTGPNIVFQRQPAASTGLKLTETSSPTIRSINFAPTGVGATQTSFTICRATPTVGTQQREVIISATGRASAARKTASTCS